MPAHAFLPSPLGRRVSRRPPIPPHGHVSVRAFLPYTCIFGLLELELGLGFLFSYLVSLRSRAVSLALASC
eukprot:741096-Hanusia_phi.AAC.1